MEILPRCAYDPALWPRPCPQIAPEVSGVVFEWGQRLYVPFLFSRRPGCGFVSRYLDGLPADQTVVFPTVLSPVLKSALLRRGFSEVDSYAPAWGEQTQSFIRERAAASAGRNTE